MTKLTEIGMSTSTEASRPRPGPRTGPRMTLNGYFMPTSVFVPAALDSEGST